MIRRAHVIGATGRTGAVLCRLLLAQGWQVVPIVRDPARWSALDLPGEPRMADLSDPEPLSTALSDATRIVSVSYAAWTQNLLRAAPPTARLVLVGTARRYSEPDDAAGRDALAAETLLCRAGREGVMLHPTMIYGAPEDGTVSRLATLIRRTPVLPLPGGGRALVQPVHVDDVALAIQSALDRPWPAPIGFAVAGPAALPYAALIRAVAYAIGARAPLILPIPRALTRAVARGRPGVMRMLTDRSAETATMARELQLSGRTLEQGLAQMFR